MSKLIGYIVRALVPENTERDGKFGVDIRVRPDTHGVAQLDAIRLVRCIVVADDQGHKDAIGMEIGSSILPDGVEAESDGESEENKASRIQHLLENSLSLNLNVRKLAPGDTKETTKCKTIGLTNRQAAGAMIKKALDGRPFACPTFHEKDFVFKVAFDEDGSWQWLGQPDAPSESAGEAAFELP